MEAVGYERPKVELKKQKNIFSYQIVAIQQHALGITDNLKFYLSHILTPIKARGFRSRRSFI